MKEEYYIQGDPARANEIKAAFEAKGIDTTAISTGDEDWLYFSSNGLLHFEEFSNTLLNIFKTHPGYTELPLPVKPKFKVGDTIQYKDNTYKIIGIHYDTQHYLVNGGTIGFAVQDCYHLWTIQDAKDGDVLVDTLSGTRAVTILFRGINADDSINAYCGWNGYTFSVTTNGAGYGTLSSTRYVPATKEQRSLLFAKMQEAGYEWDEKKKELRRIIKPKFKVGDWLWHKEKGVFPMMVEDYDEKEGYLMLMQHPESKCYFGRDIIENDYRLWEISDAKEGDVLAVDWNEKNGHVKNKWEKIVIFKSINKVGVEGYGCTFRNNKLAFDTDVPYYSTTWTHTLKPASKKQRDLLFQKMKKAGYKWDADKKELKKIINPKFKVGDWIVRNNGSSYTPIQVYCIKKDRYLVTNMLGSKGEMMINRQDEWHLWKTKFKVGDWITDGISKCQIHFIDNTQYWYSEYSILGSIESVNKRYRLWEISDAKDGDVLVDVYGNISIYEKCDDFDWMSYCSLGKNGGFQHFKIEHENEKTYPATKEQRDLLFKKMKEDGYEWDVDKKELKKIQPHYDIAKFYAGMPVLVRDDNNRKWCYLLYSHYDNTYGDGLCFNAGSVEWRQCIPFNEDTNHLLGTTDMCDEQYINW